MHHNACIRVQQTRTPRLDDEEFGVQMANVGNQPFGPA